MIVTRGAGNQAADLPNSVDARMLLVSVWFDTPGRAGFRARVSTTTADEPLTTVHVTANPATVPAAVEAWLDRVLREISTAPDEH
jgi:hypothetical protein